MKKNLIAILFVLGVHFGFTQANVYHHFPDSNAVWREEYGNNSNPGFFYVSDSGYSYRLRGDTNVNGRTYHKVYEEGGYEFFSPSGTVGYYHKFFEGAIREDTLKHIFLCCTKDLGTKDTLLYDFNLKIGDTLRQYDASNCSYCGGPFYVTSIDSIQLLDSSYRKVFYFDSNSAIYIIEGIGSSEGLLDQIYKPFEIGTSLNCFQQNNRSLYSIYGGDTCPLFDSTTGIAPIQKLINVVTYPNPAQDKVSMVIKGFEGAISFSVFDMIGRQVLPTKRALNTDEEFFISVRDLSTGVYMLKVSTVFGVVVKKIDVVR